MVCSYSCAYTPSHCPSPRLSLTMPRLCVLSPPQGLIICLFFNFIATTAALIGLGGENIGSWLWSALYATGGIPGAFILWHMRLYNSAIKDSAFGYAIFFLFFVVAHMIFCVWSAVGECRCIRPQANSLLPPCSN